MSASDKKKLRKEQQNTAMTEKQLAEKKQQKKLHAYTITFVIAMVLVVAIVLVSSLTTPVINLLMGNTVALTVDGHGISAVEFNYYYKDYINNFYSQFSSGGEYQDLYVQMYTGLNPAAPLEDQVYNSATGDTWADYFADCAIQSAKWTYAMYDAAKVAGYTLSEAEQESLDSLEDAIAYYAAYNGLSDSNTYLKALYGSSASLKSYIAYCEMTTIASSYSNSYIDGLEFTDDDFRAYEADKMVEYNSYSYAYYYVKASDYLTGGTTTKDEDGKETTTYSDEEKAASVEAALADAKTLAVSTNNTVEALNTAIQALNENTKEATATESPAVLYSNLLSVEGVSDWLTSEDRVAGDITYLPYTTHSHAAGETHSEDEDESKYETVNGYYVVLYLETIDNTMSIGNVRHLLVMFKNDEGKTYSDGIKSFTDEQKATAKAKAEDLLEQFNGTKKSEEDFTVLVKANSEDTGTKSNGGLIQGIYPDAGYVKSFTDWGTAMHKPGDVEIIESEYGYHIMYYVGAEELNYRDTMINNDLIDEAYTEWEEALLEKVTATEGNMKYLESDFIISK